MYPYEIWSPPAVTLTVPFVPAKDTAAVNVGDADRTTEPVPVLVVTPVPPLPTGRTPLTPVVRGKPVAFVKTTADGVPSAGVTRVGLVDRTVLPLPVLVVTPVPPAPTASVPPSMMVPAVVIGPPVAVKPVVPLLTLTLVTVPDPPEAAMVIVPAALVMDMLLPAVRVLSA